MSAFGQAHTVTDIASAQAMGKGGMAIFNSSAAFSSSTHPMASGFLPLTDTVFSAFTGSPQGGFREADNTKRSNYHNYSNVAIGSITWPAGVYFPGSFTDATISSGLVLIYF